MKINIISSGSKGNCIQLKDADGNSLLLECGVPFKKIQKGTNFETSKIDGCLITHSHKDHAHCVSEFLDRGIECYGPEDVFKDIKNHTAGESVKVGEPFSVGPWMVIALQAYHDVPCYAYAIRSINDDIILYVTDTAWIDARVKNVTHLLTECNYDPITMDSAVDEGRTAKELKDRIIKTHLGLENVVNMIERNPTWHTSMKEVYLLHMSEVNCYWKFCQEYVKGIIGVPTHIVE